MWDKEWESNFFFGLNVLNEAECLVCNQVIKTMKAYSLNRHYRTRHPDHFSVTGNERKELLLKLKANLKIKYNHILKKDIKKPNISECAKLKATYVIALALAKKGRPFGDGTFFKEMCLSIMPFFGEVGNLMGNEIREMSLSRQTIVRRTEHIGHFIQAETIKRIENAKYVSVCFDESFDIRDTRQMIICIKTIDEFFDSFEEILKLESTYGNVITGKAIFESFERNVLSVIDKRKLSAICTDGAAVMVERHQDFVGFLNGTGIKVHHFHFIIHQQALFAKTLRFDGVMITAVKIINRLREGHNSLTHGKLKAFLEDVNADYGDISQFTEVRWLRRGKSLERIFVLREEIATFLQSEASLTDAGLVKLINCPHFLLELAFLVDIMQQINNLNLVLQGKSKNICELFYAVCEFTRKLKILRDQIASNDLSNFVKVSEVFSISPNQRKLKIFSEEINKLIDNFGLKFKDLYGLQWVINIFSSPLTCSVENIPSNIKLEIMKMREDLSLPVETGISFWKSICPKKYGASRDLILHLGSMFSTTYICESSYSELTQIKNKYRTSLTDSHLETLLKIKCYDKEIDIENLVEFHNNAERVVN